MSKKSFNLLVFAKNLDGGTGTYIQQLKKLEEFSTKDKINVRILALEYPTFRQINDPTIIYFRKRHLYSDYYSLSAFHISRFFSDFFWYIKMVKSVNPSVIVAIDIHCNLIASTAKLLLFKKTPLILTTHININHVLKEKAAPVLSKLLIKLISHLYQYANSNIAVCKGIELNLKKEFHIKTNVTTIYHGIPEKITKNVKKSKSKTIVAIGRMVSQKDYYTILFAFEKTYEQYKKTKLILVGDGPLKKELITFSQTLKSKKNIIFIGWVQNVNSLLQNASIFVLSSHREGFPYTILEAMSQSVPIVATDIEYGPSEALKHGKFGILIPPKDIKAMKEAFIELLSSDSTYADYKHRSFLGSKMFSEEKMLKQYITLIAQLI